MEPDTLTSPLPLDNNILLIWHSSNSPYHDKEPCAALRESLEKQRLATSSIICDMCANRGPLPPQVHIMLPFFGAMYPLHIYDEEDEFDEEDDFDEFFGGHDFGDDDYGYGDDYGDDFLYWQANLKTKFFFYFFLFCESQ